MEAIHIIFVTGYSQYMVDAFAIHATGHLLKPVEKEDVEQELTFLYGEPKRKSRIQMKTFGGFEVFVDGAPIRFERSKIRELLAYLVDRRMASVTSGEAYAALFEDAEGTTADKSYFRTILHKLMKVLKKVGAACNHKHDGECDYIEGAKGSPCTFMYEIYRAETTEPEEESCTCATPCTEDAGLAACRGEVETEQAWQIIITGFDELPEEVAAQIVSAETKLEELNLPDTLGASGHVGTLNSNGAESLTIEGVDWESELAL